MKFSKKPLSLVNYLKVATIGLSIGYMTLPMSAFAEEPIITTFVEGSLGALRIDSQGNFYAVNMWNCTVHKITSAGVVSTFAGMSGQCGFSGDNIPATQAKLNQPNNLAIDSQDNVYIADYYNHCVRKVDKATNIITTFAGKCGQAGFPGEGEGGLATNAKLLWNHGLGIDKFDNVYVGGDEGHTIRKIHHTTKIITTIAGAGGWGSSGDGGKAYAARLGTPVGINFDESNNMIIADNAANRIRKITALSGSNANGNIQDGISGDDTISTLAGATCPHGYGACGFGGDGQQALNAQINQPETAIPDHLGRVFIMDLANFRVRMIDQNGIMSTVAGTGSNTFTGDGGLATQTGIGAPNSGVFDKEGNFYFSVGDRILKIKLLSPTMCRNPAVYDINTGVVTIPKIDVPILDPFSGTQSGIGVFSGGLYKLAGIDDFRITSFNFLNYIPTHDPTHAYYQYNDGIYGNGGKLTLCASVPQVIVLPPNIIIPAPPLLFYVVMRHLAVDPSILHLESARQIH